MRTSNGESARKHQVVPPLAGILQHDAERGVDALPLQVVTRVTAADSRCTDVAL